LTISRKGHGSHLWPTYKYGIGESFPDMVTVSFGRPLVIKTAAAARILIELAGSECNTPDDNYEDVFKAYENGLLSLKRRFPH